MRDHRSSAKLPKWPFLLADFVLLGAAYLVYWQSKTPMNPWETFFCVAGVAFGAVLYVTPFLLEYRAAMRLTECDRLTNAVLQIQNLEIIGRQIAGATANWQAVQDESAKGIQAAREIAEDMTAEARAFTEFLQKANDTEKNHLRLEVDKLRRAESDWVQTLVRVLDHVYALYRGAEQSGQANLVTQIGQFQNACRDAARRVGLTPFVAIPGESFDPKLHHLTGSDAQASAEAQIGETIATGFSYQGQVARAALVTLRVNDTQTPGPPVTPPEQFSAAVNEPIMEVTEDPSEPPHTPNQSPPSAETDGSDPEKVHF